MGQCVIKYFDLEWPLGLDDCRIFCQDNCFVFDCDVSHLFCVIQCAELVLQGCLHWAQSYLPHSEPSDKNYPPLWHMSFFFSQCSGRMTEEGARGLLGGAQSQDAQQLLRLGKEMAKVILEKKWRQKKMYAGESCVLKHVLEKHKCREKEARRQQRVERRTSCWRDKKWMEDVIFNEATLHPKLVWGGGICGKQTNNKFSLSLKLSETLKPKGFHASLCL